MKKKNVLLVEDDETHALYMQRILEKLGHSVVDIVKSGRVAVLSVKHFEDIDIIIMDISLEGDMDGIETMKQIRQLSDVKVIYTTGYGSDIVKKKAVETVYDAYLTKPVRIEDLEMAFFEAYQD
jgi:CheY-like chemotaxis protein